MNEKKQIECQEVGCLHKGFWTETDTSGEVKICVRVRHERAWHVKKIGLAELAVQTIKRNKNFAAEFQRLLTV